MAEKILILVFMSVFGAVMGSFACCQAWRIRYKEQGKEKLGKRSICLGCKKQLRWYENIPIVSWIVQGGKCRGCGKEIGRMEIWSEVAGMAVFGLAGWGVLFGKMSFPMFPDQSHPNVRLIVWGVVLVAMVVMMILAIYDAKWGELPTFLLILLIGLGVITRLIIILFSGDWEVKKILLGMLGAVGILGGLYYMLYYFSKEKLVGGGDWMLGVGIGLLVGEWWLAIWVLFLANFVGAMAMLPQRKRKIAFGPFLVGAFVLVCVFSGFLSGMMV